MDDPSTEPTPPDNNAPAPNPGQERETPTGEEAVAAFEAELSILDSVVPVIEPLQANRWILLTAFLLLIIFTILGQSPFSTFKKPGAFNVFQDGSEVDIDAGLDPDYSHKVYRDDLALDFDSLGRLRKALARGAESGKRGSILKLVEGLENLEFRVINEDDYEARPRGLTKSYRVTERGYVARRHFFDDALQLDLSVSLGQDEDGQDTRYLDIVMEFTSLEPESELRFGYEINAVDSLYVPMTEAIYSHGAALVETDKGREVKYLGVNSEDTGHFDHCEALAIATRYGIIGLVAVEGDLGEGKRRGEIPVQLEPSSPTELEGKLSLSLTVERLKIRGEKVQRHHYRLFLGPCSSWTLAGHETSELEAFVSDAWMINRIPREMELDVLRGSLQVLPWVGWGLVLVTLLFSMVLRPANLVSAWSAIRGGGLRPIFDKIQERRVHWSNYVEGNVHGRTLREMASKKVSELGTRHGVKTGCGCLMWILIWPIFFGFFDAVETGFVFREASWLWIEDLTKADRFYVFEKALYEINLAEKFQLARNPLSDYLLTYRLDSINLLPIFLYFLLPGFERFYLRRLGVKSKFSIFWSLINLAFFFFLYNWAAAIHLVFVVMRCVWTSDRIRIYRRILSAHGAHGAVPPSDGGDFVMIRPEAAPESPNE